MFASRRTAAARAVALGLCLTVVVGCSSGDVEPTEAGRQADMKAMQEATAANDATAAATGKKSGRKGSSRGNMVEMPP